MKTHLCWLALAVVFNSAAADFTPGSLRAPQVDSILSPDSLDRILRPAPDWPAPPIRRFESLSQLQAAYSQDFASQPGFGVSRLPYLPPQNLLTLEGKQYRVRTPDLLGLEGQPTAYMSGHRALSFEDLSQKEARSLLTKRELTEFERQAVPKLQAGKDLVQGAAEIQVSPGTSTNRVHGIRVVGALRATTQCVTCHQVSEGTVLGALSYLLVPAESEEPVLAWNGSGRP